MITTKEEFIRLYFIILELQSNKGFNPISIHIPIIGGSVYVASEIIIRQLLGKSNTTGFVSYSLDDDEDVYLHDDDIEVPEEVIQRMYETIGSLR